MFKDKDFLDSRRVGAYLVIGKLITPPVSGMVSAHLHCCSWLTGPASRRAAVSTSMTHKEHLFPKTWAVPGRGRMTKDLVIAAETESLEVIAAWMREGCKTPAGSSAGVGNRVQEMSAQLCQGSALCQAWSSMSQYGFSIWGFPFGISSNTLSRSVGGKKNHKLPCQIWILQGSASNILGMLKRRENRWGQIILIYDLFSLCFPLPSSLSILQAGNHGSGEAGQDVKDRPPV